MESDRDKWNAKYRDRAEEVGEPDEAVGRHLDELVGTTVLDVACGDGRNALFLAEHGFEVTGVDISEVGLERMQQFAADRGVEVEALRRDLDRPEALAECGRYDNVVITRYKPPEVFWAGVGDLIRADGVLLVSTYNLHQHREHGFPERYCLEPDELVDVSDALECVHYESSEEPRQYTDSYIFRRK